MMVSLRQIFVAPNLISFILTLCIEYPLFYYLFYWNLNLLYSKPFFVDNFRSVDNFITNLSPVDLLNTESQTIKTILLWTGIFGSQSWITDVVFSDCPVKSCRISNNKAELLSSDALIFHPRDIHPSRPELSLPKTRLINQRYIFFSLEPPYYNFLDAVAYKNIFNWTMTVRSDSDFPISYGGFFKKRIDPLMQNSSLWKQLILDFTSRPKLVAARISNCHAANTNRMYYIKQLQKYIPVDVYGYCGNTQCPKDCDAVLKQYKFHLSFENGNCRDYVTEKFWQLYSSHTIPIVMGGAHPNDYKNAAPSHSYINVADFDSPQDLAIYLQHLNDHPELLNRYFEWHLYYEFRYSCLECVHLFSNTEHTKHTQRSPFCRICAALNNPNQPSQYYHDLNGWLNEDTCSQSHAKTLGTALFPVVIIQLGLTVLIFFVFRTVIINLRLLLPILLIRNRKVQ